MITKHFEDGGDVNMLVQSDGTTLLICTLCNQTWIGTVARSEGASSIVRGGVVRNIRAHPILASEIVTGDVGPDRRLAWWVTVRSTDRRSPRRPLPEGWMSRRAATGGPLRGMGPESEV